MSGQQQQAEAPLWQPTWQGRPQSKRPWTPAEEARLRPLAAQNRIDSHVLAAMASALGRTVAAVTIKLSKLRQEIARTEAAGHGGAYSPDLLQELRALIFMPGRQPRGAVQVLAAKHGRTTAAIKSKIRDLRKEARDTGAITPSAHYAAWSEAHIAVLRDVLRQHPLVLPPGVIAKLAVEFDRSASAVECQIWKLRRAAASAVPARKSSCEGLRDTQQAALHHRELREAHPPERVERRCVACRARFMAPSRFRFRCDGCLERHAKASRASGFDA